MIISLMPILTDGFGNLPSIIGVPRKSTSLLISFNFRKLLYIQVPIMLIHSSIFATAFEDSDILKKGIAECCHHKDDK